MEALGALEAHLNGELLKHACGRAMFCPACGRVLDCRRAILATPRNGDTAGISCVECWDELFARYSAVEQAAFIARVEVLDGREVFAR